MKTFKNQIDKICKDYFRHIVLSEIQLKSFGKTTRAAIVFVRKSQDTERYYKIFYKYPHMKDVGHYGCFTDFADACKELSTFAL